MTNLFYAAVNARCDTPCMATQDAIDSLAAEFGRGRAHLLSLLRDVSKSDLHDLVMVAWAKAPLSLATGKSRDEWIKLLD